MSDLALFCQSLDRVVRFAEGSLQRQSTHVQQQSQPAERDAADDEIQGNSVEEAELLGTALQQLFVAPDVQELNKAASRTYLRVSVSSISCTCTKRILFKQTLI